MRVTKSTDDAQPSWTRVEITPGNLDAAYLVERIRQAVPEQFLQDSGVISGVVHFTFATPDTEEVLQYLRLSSDSNVEEVLKEIEKG